jgi:hypothetical protein
MLSGAPAKAAAVSKHPYIFSIRVTPRKSAGKKFTFAKRHDGE